MHHMYKPLGRNNCALTEIGIATGVFLWRYSFRSMAEKCGGIVPVINCDAGNATQRDPILPSKVSADSV